MSEHATKPGDAPEGTQMILEKIIAEDEATLTDARAQYLDVIREAVEEYQPPEALEAIARRFTILGLTAADVEADRKAVCDWQMLSRDHLPQAEHDAKVAALNEQYQREHATLREHVVQCVRQLPGGFLDAVFATVSRLLITHASIEPPMMTEGHRIIARREDAAAQARNSMNVHNNVGRQLAQLRRDNARVRALLTAE